MQLRVIFVAGGSAINRGMTHVMVSSMDDIRTASFAVASSVRSWLRNMPFVPSPADLHFSVEAEVVQDEKLATEPLREACPERPKRKRKKVK